MDIFTHMFFTYLINFGIGTLRFNEYAMVFGIMIGILPDFDVIWFPLGWKYPIARHRGISHSIVFIMISTMVLAAFVGPIIGVNYIVLCVIGFISGLSHICFDALTTIGIPAFWPFSKRELGLGLERAINPNFKAVSIFFIIFLFYLRGIGFDYAIYLQIINIIFISIILYYLAKFILKAHLKFTYSTPYFKLRALPTAGLFKWFLVAKRAHNKAFTIKYCRYNTLSKYRPRFRLFSYSPTAATPPLDDKEKVKSYTYNLKKVQSFIKRFKYPLAEVIKNRTGYKWTVFWFPVELMGMNRAMAIRVDLDPDGKYKTKFAFFKKVAKI